MLKKIFLLLIIPFIVSGCTSNQEVITFSSWGSVTETGILKKVISDFERENPDVKINFMHIPQNYFQKIHLLFASNTPPDVIFINNLNLPVYESRLEDLSGLADEEDFYPQSLEGLSYQGRLLALPRDISTLVFYINLDKVKMPSKDWSIADLPEYAKNGISFEEDIYWALPYLWAFGGGVLDEKGDVIIDSAESQEGLRFYKDLRDKYHYAPQKSQVGSSTLAQMFLDKKIGMYLSGRWMYPKISEKADFNWAVAAFPTGKYTVPCDVSGWAVSKDSKHKETAKKFVQYLAGEKSSEYFTETGLIIPARAKMASKIKGNHNEKVFTEVIKKSSKTPVNKDYKKLTDEINKKFIL